MWGKLKLLRPHRASCGQARAGNGATAGFHSGSHMTRVVPQGESNALTRTSNSTVVTGTKKGPSGRNLES